VLVKILIWKTSYRKTLRTNFWSLCWTLGKPKAWTWTVYWRRDWNRHW